MIYHQPPNKSNKESEKDNYPILPHQSDRLLEISRIMQLMLIQGSLLNLSHQRQILTSSHSWLNNQKLIVKKLKKFWQLLLKLSKFNLILMSG